MKEPQTNKGEHEAAPRFGAELAPSIGWANESDAAAKEEWDAVQEILNEMCDMPPCTGQRCDWCGCAKLCARLNVEYRERMRPKWRESKRRQRAKHSPIDPKLSGVVLSLLYWSPIRDRFITRHAVA